MPLPVVIPAAPDSPWIAACVASVRADGATGIYVVSESDPALPDTDHVPVPADAGFAARANAGLAAARADGHERALLLNDDTELVPGALAALAGCPDLVCGAVLEHWEGGVQQAGLRVSTRTARVVAHATVPADPEVDALGGAALCLDLGFVEDLGGFDERYRFYFEDIDLCVRARARGVVPRLVADARIRHRGGGTRSHRSPDAAFHLGRSHALLARRLGAGPLRLLTVASAGGAWTLGSVGLAGLPAFTRGLVEGLRAPAA